MGCCFFLSFKENVITSPNEYVVDPQNKKLLLRKIILKCLLLLLTFTWRMTVNYYDLDLTKSPEFNPSECSVSPLKEPPYRAILKSLPLLKMLVTYFYSLEYMLMDILTEITSSDCGVY